MERKGWRKGEIGELWTSHGVTYPFRLLNCKRMERKRKEKVLSLWNLMWLYIAPLPGREQAEGSLFLFFFSSETSTWIIVVAHSLSFSLLMNNDSTRWWSSFNSHQNGILSPYYVVTPISSFMAFPTRMAINSSVSPLPLFFSKNKKMFYFILVPPPFFCLSKRTLLLHTPREYSWGQAILTLFSHSTTHSLSPWF